MTDRRKKNLNWIVSKDGDRADSIEHVQLAVLMDIRRKKRAAATKRRNARAR